MELIRYDAACRAVAEAKRIDEAKEILNRAEALRAYAKQAKNRQLELDAIEIRIRAERRQGELIIVARKSRQIAVQGVRDYRNEDGTSREVPRLAEIGISGKDSATSQKLAMLSSRLFESGIIAWRRSAETARGNIPLPHSELRNPKKSIISYRGHATPKIDAKDPLDGFRGPDGRRIADWRAGELDRLADLFARATRCVAALKQAMPVANPGPFDTVEILFERDALAEILKQIWDSSPLRPGFVKNVTLALKNSSHHQCLQCREVFLDPNFKARGRRAKFCSEACRTAARNAGRYKQGRCGT